MATLHGIFDRQLLARRRQRWAHQAASCDFLLHRVADDMADRLAIVRREFPLALNLGAYNGAVSHRLRQVPNVGLIVDAELSPALLEFCDGPSVVADEEALPFAPASLDLVVSAMSLQLVNDLPGALVQIRRALKPDGLLLATFLGGATLNELRASWLAADAAVQGGASPRVAPFADVREAGSLLQRAGFALPVADIETQRVSYATPLALMQELRAMAASNALLERSRRPTTRATLLKACEHYADHYAEPDGRIRATFDLLTVTAWAPHADQPQPLQPGSAKASLAEALRDLDPLSGCKAAKD